MVMTMDDIVYLVLIFILSDCDGYLSDEYVIPGIIKVHTLEQYAQV